MYRTIRIALATLFFCGISLLFLDFTGVIHTWFGWMARLQFLPAIMALNVGIIIGLVVLTLLLGRVYCSVICPLGVMQDIISHLHSRSSRKARLRFRPVTEVSRTEQILRYVFLLAFVVLTLCSLTGVAALIAPYSAFGRIANALIAPLYRMANNGLALLAERADSYAFYSVEVYWGAASLLITAIVTLLVVGVLAWKGGRRYCNTICPVGTVLGALSRLSWFKVAINTDRCTGCSLCARQCKAEAIDFKSHTIDYSRCVGCFDCLEACSQKAISLGHNPEAAATTDKATGDSDMSRRSFLGILGLTSLAVAKAQTAKKVDGGLAVIEDKKVPERRCPIVPPGAQSLRHLQQHCTGCQLCVSACPNGVLRPSTDLSDFMQPHSSYERGYCRPECTRCSEVCPTQSIQRITAAEKAGIKIGTARVIEKNCLALHTTIGEGESAHPLSCGNCARHCPVGAITMVPVRQVVEDEDSQLVPHRPMVDTERCIGCGACENLCPARPFSAIVVDGIEEHREI